MVFQVTNKYLCIHQIDSEIHILCLKHKILVLLIPNKLIIFKDTSTQEREFTHFMVLEINLHN